MTLFGLARATARDFTDPAKETLKVGWACVKDGAGEITGLFRLLRKDTDLSSMLDEDQ